MVYFKYFLVLVLLFNNRLNLDIFLINSENTEVHQLNTDDFIIIIEDDVMRVKSSHPSIFIVEMRLFNDYGINVSSQDCFKLSMCEISLNSLPYGDYELVITDSNSKQFVSSINYK